MPIIHTIMMKFLAILLLCVAACWAGPLDHNPAAVGIQRAFGGRIIGGQAARPGQFPFMAAVYFETPTGNYFCGGTLISNQWVLTAAHCTVDATVFTIQLGSHLLISSDANRLIVATVNSVTHPRYNPETLDNDIGLIKFHLPIEFNNFIKAITLPSEPHDDGAVVTAIGWGQIGDWGTGVVDALNYVVLATVSNEECKLTYGDQITDNMICAVGNFDEGTCTGDSGGPLVEIDNSGNAIHVAVTSFISFNGCETPDPSGAIRTYNYRNWITDVTKIP